MQRETHRGKAITAVLFALCGGTLLAILSPPKTGYHLSASNRQAQPFTAAQGFEAGGGVASQPCGDGSVSQSSSKTIHADHTVQCVELSSGIPSDNGLARSFTISEATEVCAVEFGIQSTDGVGPWPATANLYAGNINGPFGELDLRGSATVTIPPNTSQQHFIAVFDEPVEFSAGESMVVELFVKSRAIADGGDGGQMFIGSNNLGQSAPSYLRAPVCQIPDFKTYAELNFPNVHVVMTVFTGDAPPQPGACCIESTAPACPGDLTGSGSVGVSDLLSLLGQWGPCPAPPATCNGDLTGSGSVGVPDLLALLGQWGPCPEGGSTICEQVTAAECAAAGGFFHGAQTNCVSPTECPVSTGACCLGEGACENLVATECAGIGGEFKGDQTTCAQATCDLGPACPDGAIKEGEPCGESINGGCFAPGAPAYSPISCGQSVCGNAWAHNDERDTDWYTITVTEQSEIVWTVDAPFPAQVAIINDQCGAGLEVMAEGESEPGSNITTAAACVPPGTYRLFVAIDAFQGYPCGSGQNNYVASVSCGACDLPEPDGDTCQDAIPIEVGGVAVGNNTGNDWKVDLYCDDIIEPESGVLWFKVEGNGTQFTASNANLPGSVTSTRMYVYCGSCETPACQEVTSPQIGVYSWCSEPGHTYYLAVWGTIGQEGDIGVTISSGNACEAIPCNVPGQCEGFCGGLAPSGCWCDDACHLLGDCCPGICDDCPQAGGCLSECAAHCGMQAPSGCWCDSDCFLFGNCCEGLCDVCPDLAPCSAGSCKGLCDTGYPAGCYDTQTCECYCDADCWIFGDCCADLCTECPGNCP